LYNLDNQFNEIAWEAGWQMIIEGHEGEVQLMIYNE